MMGADPVGKTVFKSTELIENTQFIHLYKVCPTEENIHAKNCTVYSTRFNVTKVTSDLLAHFIKRYFMPCSPVVTQRVSEEKVTTVTHHSSMSMPIDKYSMSILYLYLCLRPIEQQPLTAL